MEKRSRKQAFKHDYSGSYAPSGGYMMGNTFSVGCFQWLEKANGKGLKKGPVIFRIKGYSSKPDRVYEVAESVCDRLDAGWVPDTKCMSV